MYHVQSDDLGGMKPTIFHNALEERDGRQQVVQFINSSSTRSNLHVREGPLYPPHCLGTSLVFLSIMAAQCSRISKLAVSRHESRANALEGRDRPRGVTFDCFVPQANKHPKPGWGSLWTTPAGPSMASPAPARVPRFNAGHGAFSPLKTVTADRTVVMGKAVCAIVITVIMWRGLAARGWHASLLDTPRVPSEYFSVISS
jgi:hypothetical protein